jgi:hypothetical protein
MPFFSSIKAIGPFGARRLLAKLKAFVDNFARSNSQNSIGQDVAKWTSVIGTWGINNGKANTSTSVSSYPIVTFDAITKDAKVKATGTGDGAGFGVAFWVTDSNNWYGAVAEKSGFTAEPYLCNSPSHTLSGSNCSYSYAATVSGQFSYPCPSPFCWDFQGSPADWRLPKSPEQLDLGTCCYYNYPYTCTGTNYSCPSGGSLSGSTCNVTYGASLSQWYRNQFKIIKSSSGTVSTLQTVDLGNSLSVGTNIASIEANTSGTNAVITGSFNNSSVSSTIQVSTPERSSNFGMIYAPSTLNQVTEIETFEYEPN